MHALGWTRDAAIAFMRAHTALGDNNIANEVDRYIAWPGQALAYKLGQLEILRLRAAAETRLGARFDIRAFHDARPRLRGRRADHARLDRRGLDRTSGGAASPTLTRHSAPSSRLRLPVDEPSPL